jgi:hypothetical protein
MDAATETRLFSAELALLQAQQCGDGDAVAALLAADFEEVGSSGREYDRAGVLAAIVDAADGSARLEDFEIRDFRLRLLAADLALVRFRARLQRGARVLHSARSSLWRREDDRWRLVFHQGTPCAPDIV